MNRWLKTDTRADTAHVAVRRLTAWLDRNDLKRQMVPLEKKPFLSCSGNRLLFYSNWYKNVWLMAVPNEEIENVLFNFSLPYTFHRC